MEMIILVIHLILVVSMVLVILVQRTNSDGLSGLGGGGGGGNALFSVRGTANLLTKATSILAAGFIITSLILAYMATHKNSGSVVDSITTSTAAPVAAKDAKPAVAEKPAEPAKPQVPLAR